MSERYVRDKNNLSHGEAPLSKGDSNDDGRDEGFLLSCFFFAATLVAMVGTIVVEFDFDVRLDKFTVTRQAKLHVFDVQATGYPHGLVIGLDGCCN